jgi:hypothetical protein
MQSIVNLLAAPSLPGGGGSPFSASSMPCEDTPDENLVLRRERGADPRAITVRNASLFPAC